MKKMALAAVLAFANLNAMAWTDLTTNHFGNSSTTLGSLKVNNLNLTTKRYDNGSSTNGWVGGQSINCTTNRFGSSASSNCY